MLTGTPGASRQRSVLSVSELNREVKQLLEGSVPLLWVGGEISNFAAPSSGHWYFTLKDANAQVRCAMFRGRNQGVRFRPQNGREVIARARVSLYEGRGEFQLIVEHLEEAGFGALMRRLEELKARLRAEGLFELSRKKPLPRLPANIGVITSPTGAAIRDIIQVLRRRYPAAAVELWPVLVQGQGAAEQIAEAIRLAGKYRRHDLLIVGRGGGSLEDLWPFNEEIVARALAACPIPTISAVGHETDTTLADLAADLRAPTPSAAAEIASGQAAELAEVFAAQEQQLLQALSLHLRHLRQRMQLARHRLRHPREQLRNRAQQLDHLELRLQAAARQALSRLRLRLESGQRSFTAFHPLQLLEQRRRALAQHRRQTHRATLRMIQLKRQQLTHAGQLLHSVSPLAVLERGYAIVRDKADQIVRDSGALRPGDPIRVRLAQGELDARVEAILGGPQRH